MNKLSDYLEYMTRKEMQAASEAGQSNLAYSSKTEASKPKEKKGFDPRFIDRFFGGDSKRAKRFVEDSRYNIRTTYKREGRMRMVCTPSGIIYSCNALYHTHWDIIKRMVYDHVILWTPDMEKTNIYDWYAEPEWLDKFICLYIPYDDSKNVYCAESYDMGDDVPVPKIYFEIIKRATKLTLLPYKYD